jgi:hypothetical protein
MNINEVTIKQAMAADIAACVNIKIAEANVSDTQAILNFVQNTPDLDDSKFHEFCESLGIDHSKGEEVIYDALNKLLNEKTASAKDIAYELEKIAVGMGVARGLSQKANNLYLNMLKPALARLRAGTISPADFIKQRSRLGLTAEISDIAKPSAKTISEGMARNQALTTALRSQSGDAGKRVFTGGPGSFAGAGYTNPAGRFAPKAAPELNQVQSVGNPLLRKFKYEGLI